SPDVRWGCGVRCAPLPRSVPRSGRVWDGGSTGYLGENHQQGMGESKRRGPQTDQRHRQGRITPGGCQVSAQERGASPFTGNAGPPTPPDPTAHTELPPRQIPSNDNPQAGSVGPGVPAGFGDVHALYPTGGWHSVAWQGWPTEWLTPPYTGLIDPAVIKPGSWTGLSGDKWL